MAGSEPHSEQASEHGSEAAEGVCTVAWCPFCLAASAVRPLSPDVVGHLLKAGSEVFLAFRAVIDARGDQLDGDAPAAAPVRLEKIDVG
jgi:hypothetical protein